MTPTRILSIADDSRVTHVHRWARKYARWSTGLIVRRCGITRRDRLTPEGHGFFLGNGVSPRVRPPFWLKPRPSVTFSNAW